jgi:hypothetical protein
MAIAGWKTLGSVVLVGAMAAALPQVAFAVEGCQGGKIAAGGVEVFNFGVDQFAQFSLDSSAKDLSMLAIDDQGNVVCETPIPNTGHQVCTWLPQSGASYTLQVLRPASQADIAAAQAASAAAAAAAAAANAAPNSNRPSDGGSADNGDPEGSNSDSGGSDRQAWNNDGGDWGNSDNGNSDNAGSDASTFVANNNVSTNWNGGSAAPDANPLTESVALGPVAGLGGPRVDFTICSWHVD